MNKPEPVKATCSGCKFWVAPRRPIIPSNASEFGICRHWANDTFHYGLVHGGVVRLAAQPSEIGWCEEWRPAVTITPEDAVLALIQWHGQRQAESMQTPYSQP